MSNIIGIHMVFDETDPRPEGELILRVIAHPRFTNAQGDIYAGWLLDQMDQAAAQIAMAESGGRWKAWTSSHQCRSVRKSASTASLKMWAVARCKFASKSGSRKVVKIPLNPPKRGLSLLRWMPTGGFAQSINPAGPIWHRPSPTTWIRRHQSVPAL